MTLEVEDDLINTPDILAHYGVPGMKWGIRRSSGQLAVAKVERKAAKKAAKEEKKAEKSRSSDIRKDPTKTRYSSPAKKLTDAELTERIKRMETEKKYAELNSRTVGKGEQMAVQVMTSVGTATATKVGNGAVQYAIRQKLAKKMNPEAARQIVPPPKKG